MTYHAHQGDHRHADPLIAEDLCFECGKLITSASVSYDGYAMPDRLKSLYFHPACAALVGQRLICDGFPNRRKG